MKFHTELKGEEGRSVTGIEVPPEVAEGLGSGKRPAVKVTINGSYTYRNTIAAMGGAYMIDVSAEHRAAAGLKAGDAIDVPADLALAIDAAPDARRYFDTLSYSKKLALVNKMNVKNPDVRKERIESTVAQLLAGKV